MLKAEFTAKQIQALHDYFPEEAQAWISGFAERLNNVCEAWELEPNEEILSGFPTNKIYYVSQRNSNQSAVLKFAFELQHEVLALKADSALVTPRVLRFDDEYRAVLLERLQPGTMFRDEMHDPLAFKQAAELLWKFPKPLSSNLKSAGIPHYVDWLFGATDELLKSVDEAELVSHLRIGRDLLKQFNKNKETHPDCFIHGDLHHQNILRDNDRGWMVIDPKGVIAPAVMECGRFAWNFIEDEIESTGSIFDVENRRLNEAYQRRISALAQIAPFTRQEISSACFIDACLVASWSLSAEGTSAEQIDKANHKLRALRCLL